MRRRSPVNLAKRGLAGAMILAVSACSSTTSLFKQSAGAIFFPEILPDTIPVSPPLSSLGAIYGHVQDPNGFPLPGARITNGSAVTMAGDGTFVFPTREINATDDPIPVKGVDGVALAPGDFVLDGLPLGANTLTVSFDEAQTQVPVFVSVSSFSALVDAAANIGPPNYSASIANPVNITVPFFRAIAGSDGLRVADVQPPSLSGTISSSTASATPAITWASGSKVSLVLRITPPATAPIEVASASIVYENSAGQNLPDPGNPSQALQVIRNISPQVTVLPGTSKTSGEPATLVLDLANSKVASDDIAAAQITFIIQDPAKPSLYRAATDPRGQTLTVTVPISLTVGP